VLKICTGREKEKITTEVKLVLRRNSFEGKESARKCRYVEREMNIFFIQPPLLRNCNAMERGKEDVTYVISISCTKEYKFKTIANF
jgi:ssRNA-specific RNase YbeY (16S rRNA maturation enzyme)